MSEPPVTQPPESAMDRAMERITDPAPVEVLRKPTTGRTVRGPVGRTPKRPQSDDAMPEDGSE